MLREHKNFTALIILIIVSLIGVSCEFGTKGNTEIFPDGCYDEVRELHWEGMPSGDKLSMIVVTDVHKGREWNDPGVKRCEKGFMDFVEETGASEHERMPIVALGDISDHGGEKYYDLIDEFFLDIHERTNAPILYTVGNHEMMDSSVRDWEAHFTEQNIYFDPTRPTEKGEHRYNWVKTMGTYRIDDTLIYNLNSSYRIFGSDQLRQIEESLKKNHGDDIDTTLYLSHIPMASSRLNQSLFWFTMADADERNEMLKIMETWGPSFRLSGHLHEGDILTDYSKRSKEFIFTAFHSRDVSYDKAGYWHIFELDKATHTVTIYSYDMYREGITLENYDKEGTYDRIHVVELG